MYIEAQRIKVELYWLVMIFGSNKQKKRMYKKVKRNKKLMAIIMMSAYHHPRIRVAFLSAHVLKNAATIALKAQSVLDKSTKSSYLTGQPNLVTVLSALQGDITALLVLISNAEGGSDSDVEKLKLALPELVTVKMKPLLDMVQNVSFLNKGEESDVAISCDMEVVATPKHSGQIWKLRRAGLQAVETISRIKGVKGRYAMVWQRTSTPGDENSWWLKENYIYPTTVSRNIVSGLTLKTEVYFRYCIVTSDGISDWSDVISIIIT